MASRLVPGGLRSQLALVIAAVAVLGVVASFLALRSGVESRLRSQIDANLRAQAAEWAQLSAHTEVSTPAGLEATARRFLKDQRYHASSLIFLIAVNGGRAVTNAAEVVGLEEERERRHSSSAGLLNAAPGLSSAPVSEAGNMRVLTQPITSGGRAVGALRIAAPLRPVEQALSSLTRTFLVVGLVVLVVAVLAAVGLARLIARPLRRIARVASAVEAGDLSMRAGFVSARGEVGVLADAFDHMLAQLQRAFERQRDFVSDASHELRTPLAVIRAQAELLDQERDEQRRHEGTATLLRRLDQLDRLVGDMLLLASAEGGQLVEPHTIDLVDFFEDLRRDLPLFGERAFRLLPVGGTLRADAERLTQVLRNLIRNAVAHTKPGGRVSVVARARDSKLEIAVSDDGPGIPPDQLELVFERFHRVDGGRSREDGGSGLGLAIARAIVEAHGGTIRAESSPSDGATIRLLLPGYASGARQTPRAAA
ncbi:MAG TPA: HAMP domain-containing sensor histidine kinase [Solirubrobacteraceae bacterium]|nr:HAMP domain-containing sensor histidine kinase [Solirubrobacteraceae bacterium]